MLIATGLSGSVVQEVSIPTGLRLLSFGEAAQDVSCPGPAVSNSSCLVPKSARRLGAVDSGSLRHTASVCRCIVGQRNLQSEIDMAAAAVLKCISDGGRNRHAIVPGDRPSEGVPDVLIADVEPIVLDKPLACFVNPGNQKIAVDAAFSITAWHGAPRMRHAESEAR